MREWLSGRASPCQGESRGFDPRLPLPFLIHLHLTFAGLVCILSLKGRQDHYLFTTRLRVLKLIQMATSPSGKARLCKSCTSGSNPLVASLRHVIGSDHV